MKALTWHGKHDMRCETVPDPKIEHGRDAIIKVTACAICGSDLHMYDGLIPSMKGGDVVGHETMGESSRSVPRTKSSGSVIASWCRLRSPAASASSAKRAFIQAANGQTPTPKTRKNSGAIRLPVFSDIRITWAASPAARPNICASPSRMSVRSRFRTG